MFQWAAAYYDLILASKQPQELGYFQGDACRFFATLPLVYGLWYYSRVLPGNKQVNCMAHFYICHAVWFYNDWVGDPFSPGSKSTDFLSLYSRRLTTVEGNTSFYVSNLFYFSVLLGCCIATFRVTRTII
jgi:hypothetical protein